MKDKSLTFKLKCRMKELDALHRKITEFGRRTGLPAKSVLEINLALDELFTNLVSYGCAEGNEHFVRFSITLKADDLFIKMEDTGTAFNPLACIPPDLTCCLTERAIGGMGIHLVRHVMNHLAYRRCGKVNILEMKKCLAGLACGEGPKLPAGMKKTSAD